MAKKYDWNVIVLEDLTSVMIRKAEEAGDFHDWKTVKPAGKPVAKKAKEAEDIKRRPRRNEGGADDDLFDRLDNYKSD